MKVRAPHPRTAAGMSDLLGNAGTRWQPALYPRGQIPNTTNRTGDVRDSLLTVLLTSCFKPCSGAAAAESHHRVLRPVQVAFPAKDVPPQGSNDVTRHYHGRRSGRVISSALYTRAEISNTTYT